MSSLKQLQAHAIAFRDARNWRQFHGPKDLALGMLVELGELTEHVQYLTGVELEEYLRTHRQEVGEEMSDVFFWLLLMAEEFQVDLADAFKRKMEKNALKYPVRADNKMVGKLANKLENERAQQKTGL